MSVGLRNEPRNASDVASVGATYNFETWYTNMVAAANGVHAANPTILVFFSGLNYDTDLSPIPTGASLGSSGQRFLLSDFSYRNKMVLEIHNYQTSSTCSSIESTLYNGGYSSMDTTNTAIVNVMPVVLTEWGHDQTDAEYSGVYATCLKKYLGGLKGGWMVWVIAGSYYIREVGQDLDETWGLFNHEWSAWRQAAGATAIKGMVDVTLA
jgi:hypothetical protein